MVVTVSNHNCTEVQSTLAWPDPVQMKRRRPTQRRCRHTLPFSLLPRLQVLTPSLLSGGAGMRHVGPAPSPVLTIAQRAEAPSGRFSSRGGGSPWEGQGGEQSRSYFSAPGTARHSARSPQSCPVSPRDWQSPCEGQHSWPWCCPRQEEVKHKIFPIYYQRDAIFMYLKELLEMLICTVSVAHLHQQRINLSMFIKIGITLHFLK